MKVILLAVFTGSLALSQVRMQGLYEPAFPSFNELVKTEDSLQDAAFIVGGFRALAADMAWIQLLQNMGGNLPNTIDRKFSGLKDNTLRVTRLDPWFVRAYLFGAATLAWLNSTNRPDEALDVLAEGIRYNPRVWTFRTYAAGIGYMKKNEMAKMIVMLEAAVAEKDCPAMVKSILANAYKAQGRYSDAIVIWEHILTLAEAAEYHQRAREEIPKLRALRKG